MTADRIGPCRSRAGEKRQKEELMMAPTGAPRLAPMPSRQPQLFPQLLLLLLLLGTAIERTAGREYNYCYANENDPYVLMATKTAYQFVYGKPPIPSVPNCEPEQIWLLARHGTRYPSKNFLRQLPKLNALQTQLLNENGPNVRLCDADLDYLRNWRPRPDLDEATADRLTSQGEQDMRLLARRLQSNFPQLLRPSPQDVLPQNYKFRATKTERTQASLAAFMDGLFYNSNAVPAEPSVDNDTLLRSYKNCPAWTRSLDEDHVYAEAEKFIAGHDYQNLVQNVSRRLGFKYLLDNDSIQLMYDVCRYEKAWDVERLSAWCAVFSNDELKLLEYLQDLRYYYRTGPGREVNARLSCALRKDLFGHFKNLARGDKQGEPRGIFYFSHTVMLQALFDALGVVGGDGTPLTADGFRTAQKRAYRISQLGSFASNLAAVFYSCRESRSPSRVIFYLNESPLLLDGCRVGLCDWDYLEERYGRAAEECDLGYCQAGANSILAGSALLLLALLFLSLLQLLLPSSSSAL